MNAVEIIRKKRDKEALSDIEIDFIIQNYTKRKIPDYQFSSFLMAGFLNGFNETETAALTKCMLYSGTVIDLSDIPGLKIDKHSTGGVGDKTSLILAPIVAAAGINVPMISGRGLGHTGGTLDKLESITGFRTNLNLNEYKNAIKKCGAVLIGQTEEIAPADKLIYSLRDVTATVESIPLITASIMSKKLAEGIDGLVLDVKTGSGAFMKEQEDSEKLARSLIGTASAFGKKVIAFITDMNQPLGTHIGNWLEVVESVKVLQGEKVETLLEVTLNLAGAMIFLGEKAGSVEEGIYLSEKIINSGKAFDKFLEITELQGGETSLLKNTDNYCKSNYEENVFADREGYLSSIDNYKIGVASLELGAGRLTKEDKIDFKAGIIFYPEIGSKIKKGDLIARIFTDKQNVIEQTKKIITSSIYISEESVKKIKMIKTIIKGD
ncbi:MAG: thymidine phosphorylase [Ignavibacteria bacterium]|nr:thymidine phosphorylase [Ignavibacteria bacterium]